MTQRIPFRLVAAVALLSGVAAPAAAQSEPTVTQICLAPATVVAAPNGVDPLTAVSEAFTSFLTGPTLAVQPLTARLQSQVRQEAKHAGCQFLLLPTVKHERKSGGRGLLGKAAAGAVQQGAWAVSGAAGGSAATRIAAGAAAGAASGAIHDYSSNFRQQDELMLSFRLESTEGKVLLEKSEKRKAKADGEDVLTPMTQRAAEAIAEAVAK
jgi:hypothetical protein